MSEQETPPLVVTLNRVGPADAPLVGGKAANLGEMTRLRLPVPRGFCVTTAAYERMRPTPGAVADAGLSAEVEEAIVSAWERQGARLSYAVRSSATAEDLPNASFAGQHATFLNIRGQEALLEAVRFCWASLFSDRATVYRAQHEVDHEPVAMAVLIQEFVPAAVSGVLFTADPVTGDADRIIIEATWGLGEALVSGKVSPDRIVLDKQSLRVLSYDIADKPLETVPGPAGGVREQPVAEQRRRAPCLGERTARRLGKLACRVERAFGVPQDIEWAVNQGRVVLLQSRPITTLSPVAEQDRTVWSNVNVGEVMPGVITPLSWSVIDRCVGLLFAPILNRLGVHLDDTPWFGLVAGRMYANVSTFVRIIRAVPGRMDLNEMFGGQQGKTAAAAAVAILEKTPPASRSRKLRMLSRLTVLALWLVAHSSMKTGNRFVSNLRRRMDEFARTDLSTMPEEELLPFAQSIIRVTLGVTTAATHALVGITYMTALLRLARAWLGDEEGAIANRLVSVAGGMDSAEAGLDWWRLAAWAHEHAPVARALMAAEGFAAVQERLTSAPEGREFLCRWDDFMFRHGHHAQGELDVHNPRWSETPDHVLDLLRSYLRNMGRVDPVAFRRQCAEERERLLADCRKRLRNPLKRLALSALVTRAQQGLALRENFKSQAVRLLAVVRRALVELGRRLARRGVLADADDLFFLSLEEIEPVRRGEAPFDVAETMAARKAEYARNQALHPPPVIVGRYDPSAALPDAPVGPTETMRGLAVSPGVVTGPARVILRADTDERVLPGEILVAPFTDPGWTPHFLTAAGIVMEMGGMLSHGCIVARELGIPAVANVGPATTLIRTGQMIQVDGNRGVVALLDRGSEA